MLKFDGIHSIHNLGMVGHIEDIVVNKDQQGKKLGLRIIEALDHIAEKVGCYKVSPLILCTGFPSSFTSSSTLLLFPPSNNPSHSLPAAI